MRVTIATVILDRPEVRNAVDPPTAAALVAAFQLLEADDAVHAIVLWGAGGTFCAGADLRAVSEGWDRSALMPPSGDPADAHGPMGPTRLQTRKPVIAAVAGHAVAGGLEFAAWCDLRVAEADAVFGVFCRRWGVPLIDGGTLRLPRLIGESRALDMILTGRAVKPTKRLRSGLVNRVVAAGRSTFRGRSTRARDRRAFRRAACAPTAHRAAANGARCGRIRARQCRPREWRIRTRRSQVHRGRGAAVGVQLILAPYYVLWVGRHAVNPSLEARTRRPGA